ncbi:MAG: M24 family metallopeptidase [Longimicrobiales bacterium]
MSTSAAFGRLSTSLPSIRDALADAGVDGWLLYDLHARNPIANGLLGVGDLTRRYFVLLRAEGQPVVLMHGIEEAPWADWPWETRRYVGWRELESRLRELLGGLRTVAMETIERDAVPAIDFVPAGVVDLVRAAGVDVVASGDLASRFYARWSSAQLESHRRAAGVLADVARDAFTHLADRVRTGETQTEGELKAWVLRALTDRGCGAGPDCIVANGVNAASPHYDPGERGAAFRPGDIVLLDLWAKEADDLVYADQTWMAVLGPELPAGARPVWEAIRDARDAGVRFLQERWGDGPIRGHEVDDVVRGVVEARGYGDAFIHRTGHSIDRDTHGTGPNIDNLETHEVRALIDGVGFSIEPGIYLPGTLGMRTEINVHIGETGPEVTPREPQREPFTLLERS